MGSFVLRTMAPVVCSLAWGLLVASRVSNALMLVLVNSCVTIGAFYYALSHFWVFFWSVYSRCSWNQGGGIWSLTSFSGILPGFLGFFGFLLLSFEITRIFKWLGVVFEASIDNFYLWLASNSRWRCHGVGEGFLQLHAVVLGNPI